VKGHALRSSCFFFFSFWDDQQMVVHCKTASKRKKNAKRHERAGAFGHLRQKKQNRGGEFIYSLQAQIQQNNHTPSQGLYFVIGVCVGGARSQLLKGTNRSN
jgi:hypothetical protein